MILPAQRTELPVILFSSSLVLMQSSSLPITSRKNAARPALLVSVLHLIVFDVSEGGSEKGKAA